MIVEPNKTNKSGMVEKFASAYRGLIYSRARAPRVILPVVVCHRGKRRSTGEDAATLGVGIGLLGGALCLAGRIGQGKDDRGLIDVGHQLQDLLVEGSALGSSSDQDIGTHLAHRLRQGIDGFVQLGKVQLVLGESTLWAIADDDTTAK